MVRDKNAFIRTTKERSKYERTTNSRIQAPTDPNRRGGKRSCKDDLCTVTLENMGSRLEQMWGEGRKNLDTIPENS